MYLIFLAHFLWSNRIVWNVKLLYVDFKEYTTYLKQAKFLAFWECSISPLSCLRNCKFKIKKKKIHVLWSLPNPTKVPFFCFKISSVWSFLSKILWLTFVLPAGVCGRHNSEIVVSLGEVTCPIFFGSVLHTKETTKLLMLCFCHFFTLKVIENSDCQNRA